MFFVLFDFVYCINMCIEFFLSSFSIVIFFVFVLLCIDMVGVIEMIVVIEVMKIVKDF